MKKSIFLSIIYLFVLLILVISGPVHAASNENSNENWTIPTKDANGEPVDVVTPKADRSALENVSPESLISLIRSLHYQNTYSNDLGGFARLSRDSVKHGFSHTVHHLPLEALSFYTALGAIAVYDCSIKMQSNPMACSEFGQSLKDPLSYISFSLFVLTNHSVSHFLNTWQPSSSYLPNFAINYLGMAAGSIVSSIAHEILIDSNVRYIASHFFKGDKTPIEQERLSQAWENAYRTFVTDSKHASHTTSLILSAVFSSVTQKAFHSALNLKKRSSLRLGTKRLTIMKRRIVLPSLKFVVRSALPTAASVAASTNPLVGFAMKTGHMILFFAWDHVLAPPIERVFSLNRYSDRMDRGKISILEHLTASYEEDALIQRPNNTTNYAGFLANIFSFAFNALWSSQQENNRERTNIQESLTAFLNISPDQTLSRYLDRDNLHFPETLLDIPNLAEEIETDHFTEDIANTRGDALLEDITQFSIHAQNYRETLLKEFNEANFRWAEFIKPASAWIHTAYNFYRYMIQTQGLLNFETEPKLLAPHPRSNMSNDPMAANYYYNNSDLFPDQNTKSKGILDALYFSSRLFTDAHHIPTHRLIDESKVLKFGVRPDIATQLSDQDLQILHQRLSGEHSWLGNPTENHDALVFLLNQGFDTSLIHNFRNIDLQVRADALCNDVFKGQPIDPNILYTRDTHEIYWLTDFLKNQPEHIRYEYISLANQGWNWHRIRSLTPNALELLQKAVDLGLDLEFLGTKNAQEIEELVRFLEHQPEVSRDTYINLIYRGWSLDRLSTLTQSDLDSLSAPLESINRHYAPIIKQQLQQEMRTMQPSCYQDPELGQIQTPSLVQNGARYFISSNDQSSTHYGIMYYSTLEKLLINMVCGESLEETDLVQRNNVFGSLEFNAPRIWVNKPEICGQIETVHNPFQDPLNGKYYYNLLDYVNQNIGHQITLEEFADLWENQIIPFTQSALSEYEETKRDVLKEKLLYAYNNTNYYFEGSGAPADQTVNHYDNHYALGIYQFERDMTDYYLNLLITLLPKQDYYLNRIHHYVRCIRQLAEFPGNRFGEILGGSASCQEGETTWDDQVKMVFSTHNARLLSSTITHKKVLRYILKDMLTYIEGELPHNQNNIILLAVVRQILDRIEESILHSSEIEMQTNILSST